MAAPDPQDDGEPEGHGDRPPAIEQQISDNLRRLYQASLDEELPARLRDLLERLQGQARQDD
jgi:hypothetical protein